MDHDELGRTGAYLNVQMHPDDRPSEEIYERTFNTEFEPYDRFGTFGACFRSGYGCMQAWQSGRLVVTLRRYIAVGDSPVDADSTGAALIANLPAVLTALSNAD